MTFLADYSNEILNDGFIDYYYRNMNRRIEEVANNENVIEMCRRWFGMSRKSRK